MLRGNHEDCARAGTGWFFLLSPQAMPARGCANKTNPYYLNLGNVILGVLDTAHIGDSHAGYSTEEWSVNVKSVLTNMKKIAGTNATWLLMHHPVWVQTKLLPDGEVTELESKPVEEDPRPNIRNLVKGVALILSGDTHAFEALVPHEADRAVQLVAGTAGTKLENKFDADEKPIKMSGIEGTLWSRVAFGFVMLTRDDDGWKAAFYDPEGTKLLNCTLFGERKCEKI